MALIMARYLPEMEREKKKLIRKTLQTIKSILIMFWIETFNPLYNHVLLFKLYTSLKYDYNIIFPTLHRDHIFYN
jgi:hypothetical protein